MSSSDSIVPANRNGDAGDSPPPPPVDDELTLLWRALCSLPCSQEDFCRKLGANRVLGCGQETLNLRAFASALSAIDRKLDAKVAFRIASVAAGKKGDDLGRQQE